MKISNQKGDHSCKFYYTELSFITKRGNNTLENECAADDTALYMQWSHYGQVQN